MLTVPRPTQQTAIIDLESAMRRLSMSLAKAASETAAAFFCSEAVLGTEHVGVPRLSDLGSLHCSQRNIGDKYEMVCNLAVESTHWSRLFSFGESEIIRQDALCEMANCICGTIIADPTFADEFGYLIPCVPCAGRAKAPAGSRSLSGAFRVNEAWIHFSITLYGVKSAELVAAA